MKKVTELYRFDSRWIITGKFTFFSRKYFCSKSGHVFEGKRKISTCSPDIKKSIEVRLIDDTGVFRRFKVHQIICQTYKPEGIENGKSVDHIKKENRLDNSISNLRWAGRDIQYTNRENIAYKVKKVKCLNNKKVYNSCQHAEIELKLIKNTVSRVARGDKKSIHGYLFKFV